ncbi:MAG: hypothetical protein RI973_910 [Bacteroidota bacterium]|jgi:gliding motility-associated-like protein
MDISLYYRIKLTVICVALACGLSAQNANPTVAVCNGQQTICAYDQYVELCAQIVLNPNYPNYNLISHFELSWGDSSLSVIIPFSPNPPEQYHTYNLGSFYQSCFFQTQFSIILKTYHTDPSVEPTNSLFFITVRNPPAASFVIDPSVPCTGEPVKFIGSANDTMAGDYPNCPFFGNPYEAWNLGDGITGTGGLFTYVFDTAGIYSMEYCAGNSCDTVCSTQSFEVVDAAKAQLAVDSGAVQIAQDRYRLCLSDSVEIVRLDASQTYNATVFNWAVDGPSGWQWNPPLDSPAASIVTLQFSQGGIYTISLEVNNDCLRPDSAAVVIEVLELPPLTLPQQPDTCSTISYTPWPLLDSTVYTINGVAYDSFPVSLGIASEPYIITAYLDHFCGIFEDQDTFTIQPISNVQMLSPAQDTAICIGSAPLALAASGHENWLGPFITEDSTGVWFSPVVPGSHVVTAEVVFGVCRSAGSVVITVETPYLLSLDEPELGCVSTDYTPSPYDPAVDYFIDGVLQDSFPVALVAAESAYSITAAFANSCGNWEVNIYTNVIVAEAVEILAPVEMLFCEGAPAVPLLASDTIGNWSGPHVSQTAAGAFFNPVSPGVFAIHFERGSGICYTADSIVLTVLPADTVDAGGEQFRCQADSFYVLNSSTPPNGIYSGFGLAGDTLDLLSLEVDSAYSYLYTIPAFPPGCNTDTFNLTVTLPPDGGFILDSDTVCQETAIQLSPAAVSGVGYLIDWGDGLTDSVHLMHSYSEPGQYEVHYSTFTLNPMNGQPLCTVGGLDTVIVPAPLAPGEVAFGTTPPEGCSPFSVSFDNNSAVQNEQYLWDFGNGQQYYGYSPPAITFAAQQSSLTSYVVRLSVPKGCGSFEAFDTVEVFPLPVADFGISNTSPCSGALVNASVLSIGAPTTNVFQTSNGLVVPAQYNLPVSFQFFTGTSVDTVGIWLISSNLCGTDTAYEAVIVTPSDVTAAMGLPAGGIFCQSTPAQVVNLSTDGAPVIWSVSNGNSYVGDTLSLNFSLPGNYTITLFAYGCGYDSVAVPVTVFPAPGLELEHAPYVCAGVPLDFQVSSNVADLLLSYGDGQTSSGFLSQHVYSAAGNYEVVAQVTSAQGCQTSVSGNLTVLEQPQVAIAGEDTVCSNETVLFTGSSSMPGVACSWNFGDGNLAGGCSSWYLFGQSGWYPVVFTALSSEGCAGTDTLPVLVRLAPDAGIGYTVLDPCLPVLVDFYSNSQHATSHNWSLGDGSTATAAAFQHSYPQSGTYAVQLVATNNGNCPDTATVLLPAFKRLDYEVEITQGCTLEEGAELVVNTDPLNVVVLSAEDYFSPGDVHRGLQPGNYLLTVQDNQGCKKDSQLVIFANDVLLTQVAEDSFVLLLGESAELELIANKADIDISWEPPSYLDDPAVPNPLSSPLRSIIYYVYTTDDLGCTVIDTIWVNVRADREGSIFIPTGFTPNDDGINDIFYVRSGNRSVSAIESFRVFDKYNEKVFDLEELELAGSALPEDPAFGWDGRFRSEKAEMGSYRYTVGIRYIDGEVRVFTGTVQLLR